MSVRTYYMYLLNKRIDYLHVLTDWQLYVNANAHEDKHKTRLAFTWSDAEARTYVCTYCCTASDKYEVRYVETPRIYVWYWCYTYDTYGSAYSSNEVTRKSREPFDLRLWTSLQNKTKSTAESRERQHSVSRSESTRAEKGRTEA